MAEVDALEGLRQAVTRLGDLVANLEAWQGQLHAAPFWPKVENGGAAVQGGLSATPLDLSDEGSDQTLERARAAELLRAHTYLVDALGSTMARLQTEGERLEVWLGDHERKLFEVKVALTEIRLKVLAIQGALTGNP